MRTSNGSPVEVQLGVLLETSADMAPTGQNVHKVVLGVGFSARSSRSRIQHGKRLIFLFTFPTFFRVA